MNETEARRRVERLCCADREPTLDPSDVDDLLAAARRPDRDGVLPGADGWVGTWDLNAAAAEGWALKAGRAAADFDYSDDAGSYSRQQVFEMCKRQETTYRNRIVASMPLSPFEPEAV